MNYEPNRILLPAPLNIWSACCVRSEASYVSANWLFRTMWVWRVLICADRSRRRTSRTSYSCARMAIHKQTLTEQHEHMCKNTIFINKSNIRCANGEANRFLEDGLRVVSVDFGVREFVSISGLMRKLDGSFHDKHVHLSGWLYDDKSGKFMIRLRRTEGQQCWRFGTEICMKWVPHLFCCWCKESWPIIPEFRICIQSPLYQQRERIFLARWNIDKFRSEAALNAFYSTSVGVLRLLVRSIVEYWFVFTSIIQSWHRLSSFPNTQMHIPVRVLAECIECAFWMRSISKRTQNTPIYCLQQ